MASYLRKAAYARQRFENGVQAPVQMFDRKMLVRFAGEGGVTLPANAVKDFLIDADSKFAPF